MRRRLFYIISFLVIVIVVIWIFKVNYKSPQVIVIEKCLENLYNVSNYNEIEVITETILNFESFNDPKAVEYMQFGYDQFCTKRGLEYILCNRIHLLYREAPNINIFTVELKDVTLVKSFEMKEEQKIGYVYTVELLIEYVNLNKVEIIYEAGHINVAKVDGKWGVDYLKVKDLNDVFKYWEQSQ